jgi:hypothetical protein
MTKKKTPDLYMSETKLPSAASYTQVGSTSYILLSDGSFARKLKPVVVNGVSYYNLSKGKGVLMRITPDRVAEYLSAIENPQPDKPVA